MTLKSIQQHFSEAIRIGSQFPDAWFRPAGRLTHQAALQVYQRGYVARLTEQLGETYEAVWRVLGDDLFFEVCRTFIAGHSSSSHNLSHYGAGFWKTLRPFISDIPFIADLARFEWTFATVFHKPKGVSLSEEDIALLFADPQKILHLNDCGELFSSPHPVVEIWNARNKETMPNFSSNETNAFLFRGPRGGDVHIVALAPRVYSRLSRFRKRPVLAEAMEDLSSEEVSLLFRVIGEAGLLQPPKGG